MNFNAYVAPDRADTVKHLVHQFNLVFSFVFCQKKKSEDINKPDLNVGLGFIKDFSVLN